MVSALTLLMLPVSDADMRLHSLFKDHMVVQRMSTLQVKGWDEPGTGVTVKVSWVKGEFMGVADRFGAFSIKVPTSEAGGPYTISVKGSDDIQVSDVMVGDVWVCSGQSNMEWPLASTGNAAEDIASANQTGVRLFQVKNDMKDTPQANCEGQWATASPDSVKGFSAVGYLFGKELDSKTGVAIGLIDTTWGGTEAELWTSETGLMKLPELKGSLRSKKHSTLFNAMVSPLTGFPIKGAIWYQGESNVGRAFQYRRLFPEMIKDWRREWRQTFPFYFVQIAPFKGYGSAAAAELREAQNFALQLPKTGVAVITDATGNLDDIHPQDKRTPAHRLALWALAKDYKQTGFEYCGPIYQKVKFSGPYARLTFDHGLGLQAIGGPLREFEIAGADRVWKPAIATIEGESVLVYSDEVLRPVAVRMGWSTAPQPNLFNQAGLPASPFRTDKWPGLTDSTKW
ncbi:MAG: hypothetical protein JNM34_01010 [Chthonomonadaceae bacterium]|nr:hypothetical protein [Chthonomonadaceae bacterium]